MQKLTIWYTIGKLGELLDKLANVAGCTGRKEYKLHIQYDVFMLEIWVYPKYPFYIYTV